MRTPDTALARERAWEMIRDRALVTAESTDAGFPHYADTRDGRWTLSDNGDWTGGFFVGLLWLAAGRGDARAARQARDWAGRLAPRVDSDTVFRGFLFWYGIARSAGDGELADLAVRGARALAATRHPRSGVLPLGASAEEAHSVGPTEANIDGLPGTVLLLDWAARRTGDDALRGIGLAHASALREMCIRPDGGAIQSASFDPGTGSTLRRYTHKGYAPDSVWGRAQAWAMLGFAQAASLDPDTHLATARAVCDWWIAHVPADLIARWDFDDPDPDAPRDTSASAIAASALLTLAEIDAPGRDRYREEARRTVDALVRDHVTDGSDGRPAGMLTHACYNRPLGLATDSELVWGTYFLAEAILRLDAEGAGA